MLKRVLSAVVLVAIGIPSLMLGGIPNFLLIAFLGVLAAWEYGTLFTAVNYHPSRPILVGGTFFVILTRAFFRPLALPIIELVILLAMAFHLFEYEQGRDQAPVDFAITVAGVGYIGWLGSYLMDLRNLPNGEWWIFVVLPTVWLVDTGAYMVGIRYGKHKMSPRLSPKKSWEGYWGGVFTGVLCCTLFAFISSTWGPLHFALWKGALLGLLLGLLTPLGDLGESMFKRQSGAKDSGTLMPGHGGAFDRIDSWLWGAILGYYFIVWLG